MEDNSRSCICIGIQGQTVRFTVVTLFPEFFQSPLQAGLMGKARDAGTVSVDLVNPRDFTEDAHRSVDDRPYGGGPGMVMSAEPLAKALRSVDNPGRILVLTPRGKPFDQAMARELAAEENLTLVCGRYEGIDARVEDVFGCERVSVGDFVLNGGESAALNILEAVGRLTPEFMGKEASGDEESFSASLLEYPHYTRPESFEGLRVPEVLLGGDHGKIATWRRRQSLGTTLAQRPEMLDQADLDQDDVEFLGQNRPARLGRNLYLALVHYPVLNKFKERTATSLTNLDIHDMSRCSRSYDLGGFFATTPIEDQQRLARRLLSHWKEGAGGKVNPHRRQALETARVVDGLEDVARIVAERTGMEPMLVATSARPQGAMTVSRVRGELERRPVVLVFGTAHGLAPEALEACHGCLRPIRYLDNYNHLPVRSAVAITVDRILGDLG